MTSPHRAAEIGVFSAAILASWMAWALSVAAFAAAAWAAAVLAAAAFAAAAAALAWASCCGQRSRPARVMTSAA
jgi:hypothetical protein